MASMTRAASLQEFCELESKRSQRTGRGFALVRIAPVGWRALDRDVEALERVAQSELRRTDFVLRTPSREVGIVLVDARGETAVVPIARVRTAVQAHLPGIELRIGCCCVGHGEGRGWQEAWRWAGTMLVADSAVPAAA